MPHVYEAKTYTDQRRSWRQNVSYQNDRCQIMPSTYFEIVMWILVILNWNTTSNEIRLPFAKCFDMLSAKITRQKSVFEIWRQIIYLQNEYPQNKIPLYIFANSSIGISSFPIIVSQQSTISKNMKVSSENIKWKHNFSDKCRKKKLVMPAAFVKELFLAISIDCEVSRLGITKLDIEQT